MEALPKLFLFAALVAFLVAIIAVFTGPLIGVPAEGFSRACSNLALLAIGFALAWKPAHGQG